jgi:hypothetical protein
MGLVTVKGKNPFEGQSDPYISTNTSVDADIAKLTITLNGQTTGCEAGDIIAAQNLIATSFDWKADRSIPSNTVIGGIAGSTGRQIIATSLNFESTNLYRFGRLYNKFSDFYGISR